ncbi:MAG: hypothetical protein MUE66_09790, partial [Acidimicrobiia bacterium]|nr:hypothetical protein [Acidimicrobiia bacterium]
MSGQQQRKALSAAESALRALAAGEAARARAAADKAASLDQVGAYAGFALLVSRAAGEIEESGAVTPTTRHALCDALGPGPLAA